MKKDHLKPFRFHGVEFTRTFDSDKGPQAVAECPFTGKKDKLYVSVNTGLWDAKAAGLSGNLHHFLEAVAARNERAMDTRQRTRLGELRGLPGEAFEGWGIGWDGRHYTIPIRNDRGTVVDLRTWRPNRGLRTTAGCRVGLFGADRMGAGKDPVFLCEGEWDAIALTWLLKKLRKPGTCVALPGATVFKPEWIKFFQGRDTIVLLDADEPGEQGELKIERLLRGKAKSLKYIHWPSAVPVGYDIRDWVHVGAVEKKVPQKCYDSLIKLLDARPRQWNKPQAPPDTPDAGPDEIVRYADRASAYDKPASLDRVHEVFRQWLYLNDTTAIDMVLAIVLSHRLDGDPLWMFLVAPPGGAKTETVAALGLCPEIFMTSSLTPHALISGATWKGDQDPSLIPRLNGRVLTIKDFTSILSMRDMDKEEIFGILRDAYDGRCGKVFGNGVTRAYESRFTVIAAVTPQIYTVSQQHTSLGERFLKYCVGDNLRHAHEDAIIMQAIANINEETEMRWELQDVVRSFLSRPSPSRSPMIRPPMLKKIIALAKFGARMRGTVARDQFRSELVTARPTAEVGSRLGKQLAKLAMSLAVLYDRTEVTEHEYAVVRKTVLDTVPQRSEDVAAKLWMNGDEPMSTREVAAATRYPLATVARMLADMHILEIVTRTGVSNKFEWALSPYIRECIETSGLYQTPQEVERKRMESVARIKITRNKKDKP